MSGFIIYRGPSMIDNKPIVVVAITKKSQNTKTGNVIQTYILVDNGISPVDNYNSLADYSICGDCPHRRGMGGGCYVNVSHGPNQIAKKINRNGYEFSLEKASEKCSGRTVRLGSYGDPAAVPIGIWEKLLEKSANHLGYTHQWRNKIANDHMKFCMASVDSEEERKEAKALGYRTFRVRTEDEVLMDFEFVCPASSEAGKKMLCERCKACSGGVDTNKGDPVIQVHGTWKKRFRQFALLPV